VYDTVSNLSWAVDIRKHGIVSVIDGILNDPWPASMEVGREVPLAEPEIDCVVRFFHTVARRVAESGCRNALVGNLETFRRG
jgi:hypothetical protein